MARKEKDEQTRLLRNLAKEPGLLEWPCRNTVLLAMVESGLAEITNRWRAPWGGRMHDCATVCLTEAGRSRLQSLSDTTSA